MADQFTEVVTTGWLSRIGGSIVGVLFGIVFAIGAVPLLWWNEGRAVQTYRSLNEGAAAVVEAPASAVSPALAGKLVHVTGLATTSEVLQDPTFGVSAQALRVRRKVEMYQWAENVESRTRKKLGGSEETIKTYSYTQRWDDDVIASDRFKEPYGHQNPASMPYASASFGAASVTLGAYTVPGALVDRIDTRQPLAVPAASLARLNAGRTGAPPAAAPRPSQRSARGKRQGRLPHPHPLATAATLTGGRAFVAHGDGLYLGRDPGSPAVGDVRVSFEQTPPGTVSIVAAQSGTSFAPYQTVAGDRIFMLDEGAVMASAMFSSAQTGNKVLTWVLRVVGWALMFFGLGMMFRPLSVVADVVPFFGTIVGWGTGLLAFAIASLASMLTVSIAWIFYRPLVGIALAAGGVLLFLALRAMSGKRRAALAA
jgi:hypothetical protein